MTRKHGRAISRLAGARRHVLDPSQSIGTVAVARMQSTTIPMPPAPATAAEIAAISNWISAGHPASGGCRSICTSGMTWTNGNEGSPEEMKSRNGLQRLPFTRPGRIMLP